jgi:hypothetical protein
MPSLIQVQATPGDSRLDVTYQQFPTAQTYEVSATPVGGTSADASEIRTAAQSAAATLTGLTNGDAYTVAVDALTGTIVVAHGETIATPASPLTLALTPGDKQIDASYDWPGAPGTLADFRLTAAPRDDGPATVITRPATDKTETLGNLENGTTYDVSLEALATGGAVLSRTEATATPASPLSISVISGDGRIDVEYALAAQLGAPVADYRITATPEGATTPAADVTRAAVALPVATLTVANGDYVVAVQARSATQTVLTEAKAQASPRSPLAVTLLPGENKITVVWGLRGPVLTPIQDYRVAATPEGGVEGTPVFRAVTETPTVELTSLENGKEYEVEVAARSSTQAVITSATATATPFGAKALTLPPLEVHPLTVAKRSLATTRLALADAGRVGNKWRFDYLKSQAIAVAGDAAVFEQQITDLMAIDLEKQAVAEELLAPYLQSATASLQALLTKVRQLPVPELDTPARELADAINTYVLLARLLEWLATFDALQFWIGLLSRLIDDVAAFDAGLTRTRRYLEAQFGAAGVSAEIEKLLEDAKGEVTELLGELAGPLRGAVGDAVNSTAAAMQAVFDSFDEPLLVATGSPVVSPNPLGPLSDQLLQAVEGLVGEVEEEIQSALDLAKNPDQAARLFQVVVVTYVVLPILAALVIAVAGGPISAALLAAAVTLAGQELIHLLAQWLSGPLRRQLEDVQARIDEAIARVSEAVASSLPTSLDAPTDPATDLKMLASQLGAIRDLVPKAFLDGLASLLGDARDSVLASATSLALAAEQALGFENATVFDEIDTSYVSDLPEAPQLPGGLADTRFATAALLRDLARLERGRLDLLDGKEIEVTLRMSLFKLLGGEGDVLDPDQPGFFGGELPRLLRGEEVAVRLREEELLDRAHPGLYRALISDVTVRGVFDRQPAGELTSVNVPIHITHFGESRTRIRKDANLSPVENPQKWGTAYIEQDRDPTAASLGFATLVRSQPGESTVFNLFPGEPSTLVTTATPGEGPAATPLSQNAQYRPFENRGVEGTLLVRLPTAESFPFSLAEPGPTLLGTTTDPHLVDLVVDLTIRACYDPNLAAAVRAGQEQRATQLETASAIVGGGTQLLLAPTLPQTERSNLRTVHFSMRSHRDEVLRLWKAVLPAYAAQQSPPAPPTGGAAWSQVPAASQLGPNDAFRPLPLVPPSGAPQTVMPKFTVRFAPAQTTAPQITPGTQGTELAELARELVITPETLGVPLSLVEETASGAGVVGVGVTVIPTKAGVLSMLMGPRGNPTPWGTGGIRRVAIATVDNELNVCVLAGTSNAFYSATEHLIEWDPFTASPALPGNSVAVACAELDRELHAVVVDQASGRMRHAVRDGGTWSAWQQTPLVGAPLMRSVALTSMGDRLHAICVTAPLQLLYLTFSGGGWSGPINLVPMTLQGAPVVFSVGSVGTLTVTELPLSVNDVACAGTDGVLHVAAVVVGSLVGPGVWHAARRANGSWQSVTRASSQSHKCSSVGAAVVDGELHVCYATTTGQVWHRRYLGVSGWGPLAEVTSNANAGFAAPFTHVACTEIAGQLVVCGRSGAGDLYRTRRAADGSWAPWEDVVALADLELKLTDPLANLTLQATGVLGSLLPGFSNPTTPAERLTLTPFQPGQETSVDLDELFDALGNSSIVVDIDDPVSKQLLYDVIFSVTYATPVPTITPEI